MPDYNASRRFAHARLARLYGPLPNRHSTIRGVFLHSTRSGHCHNVSEAVGTENWINNPNNTGAAYDGLIGLDGAQIKACNWEQDEQPLWAGGFGDAGTWNAQQHYIHLEIAQGCITDEFTDAQVDSAAQWTAELSKIHGFKINAIAFLSQVGTPPDGITSHDRSANGRRLGKSDPGPLWPWDEYIRLARSYTESDEMTPEQVTQIATAAAEAFCGATFRTYLALAINGGDGAFTDANGKPLPLIHDKLLVDHLKAQH